MRLPAGQCRVGGADDVEHAGREASLGGQFAHHGAHQRGVRRGFQHHRAAGQQRGDALADVDVQRHVPRCDRADHAERLVHDDAVAHRAVLVAAAAILFPLDFIEAAHQVVAAVQCPVHHGAAGGAEGGAGFDAGDIRQVFLVGAQHAHVFLDECAAPGVVPRPVGLVERAARRGDRFVHVCGPGIRCLPDHLPVPGRNIVVGLVAFGAAYHAVDIQLGLGKFLHRDVLICRLLPKQRMVATLRSR